MSNPFLQLDNPEPWGPGSFEMAEPLIEAVAIRPGMRVLEVGAGSGQIAVALAKHWNVTVFTLEPWFGGERIQWLAAREGVFERVIALKQRAEQLAFAEATFDAVISIGSFEMIRDQRSAALAQMVRVAKPGARVGIAEPMCLAAPIPPDVAALDRAGNLQFQEHFRSTEWNAELFRAAGLVITEQRNFPEALAWWDKYAAVRLMGEKQKPERDLIAADRGRWLTLGMVVGAKPRG
ncbi:MAG TPA: methyltransferase domain-containing protein [Candidatus Binataceae bacterium]|nr:methyltransferase domain-containing protein [Candidatus Binataceae bacterium]